MVGGRQSGQDGAGRVRDGGHSRQHGCPQLTFWRSATMASGSARSRSGRRPEPTRHLKPSLPSCRIGRHRAAPPRPRRGILARADDGIACRSPDHDATTGPGAPSTCSTRRPAGRPGISVRRVKGSRSTPGLPASLRSRSRDGARSIGSSRQGPARSSTASERAPERGWRNPARSDRAAGYWANARKKGHLRRLRSFHDVPGRRLGGSPALRDRCLGEGPRTGRARREVSLGLGP